MSDEAQAELATDRSIRVAMTWLKDNRPPAALGRALIAIGAWLLVEGSGRMTTAAVLEILAEQIRRPDAETELPTGEAARGSWLHRKVRAIFE